MKQIPRKQQAQGLIRVADGNHITVQPRDSVPSAAIAQNARDNLQLIPKDCWVTKGRVHDEVAWILSAGPSLDRLLTNGFIRKEWFAKGQINKLWTIKHALPVLAKHGLLPHFCTVLDPRPIQGISTHGYVRKTLYSAAPKSCKFLVASMTHPSVTSWLIKNGYEVWGWHSAASGLSTHQKDLDKGVPPGPLQHITNFVQGGTCSATRSISLAHYLGFRTANLIGFDSNLASKPDDDKIIEIIEGKPIRKYWETSIGNAPLFWTTGELIAQIQDLQMFMSDDVADIKINILGADKGTSLVGSLNEAILNKTHIKNYKEMLGDWKV